MNITKIIVIFCSIFFITLSNAQITTNCIEESGNTICNATESSVNVMNVKCNSTDNKTSCSGDYKDKTTSQLQMDCHHTIDGINCSGSATDGTKFNLSCLNGDNLMKCSISDNAGESITMNCKVGVNGIPNCTGHDSDGVEHNISCKGNGNSKSCTTN